MAKKTLPWLSLVAVIALLVAAGAAPGVQAQTPPDMPYEINGLFYGDEYQDAVYQIPYLEYAKSAPLEEGGRTRGTLWKYEQDGWVYFAMVVDRSVNDNVYGGNDYTASAGWYPNNPEKGHSLNDLLQSDNMTFMIDCGQTYTWTQDYAYYDQSGDEYLSDVYGTDGDTGNAPGSLVSSSSLAWNLNNSEWDTKLANSPDVNNTGVVTDEIGYPPLSTQPQDNIMYETTVYWEWPLVFEFAFYYPDVCGDADIDTLVLGAHNSPAKDDEEDVPLAVDLLGFTAEPAKRSVVVRWETANETNNLGFNLWRAQAIDGEKTRINENLIPSQVPPAGGGAAYAYTDTPKGRAMTYYYWLEDMDIYGKSKLHGPVEATLSKVRPVPLKDLLPRLLPGE